MAPNGGHLLVGKTLRLLRLAVSKASRAVRDKLPQVAQPFEANAEPAYATVTSRPAASRIAAIRQSQSRSFSTSRDLVRQFSTSAQRSIKSSRASYPPSRTGQRVSQLTSRTPFASTLRPNLTGGTLSRSAGGYNLGAGRLNGARHFSHCPSSTAEVVQNVSQAVRAFWLSGQKAHFNGYNPKTGEKRFRAMSELQDKARHQLDISRNDALGGYIDFKVNPTITAIGPLSKVPVSSQSKATSSSFDYFQQTEDVTITNSTLLTNLEVDFARALKDLAAIMNDLRRLAVLGALPLMLIDQNTLRVRFPGCDRDTVENLCRELNIRRGIVGQDPGFDEQCGTEIALLFPFAPCDTAEADYQVVFQNESHRPAKRSKQQQINWEAMMSPVQSVHSPVVSLPRSHSHSDQEILDEDDIINNPWLYSPSGYSSLHLSESTNDNDVPAAMFFQPARPSKQYLHGRSSDDTYNNHHNSSKYEGLEGIYRFIEECDGARR